MSATPPPDHAFASGPRPGVLPPDPLGDPDKVGPTPAASPLDDLRAELTAEAELASTLDLLVEGRPGYSVRFRVDFDHTELKLWQKQATGKSRGNKPEFNELRWAGLVVANTCVAILRHGEEVETDGEAMTFGSPALHTLLSVDRSTAAVEQFYGRDAHVITTAIAIVEAAGYTDEAMGPDPTGG